MDGTVVCLRKKEYRTIKKFISNNITIPKPVQIKERKLECPYTYVPLPCEFEIFFLFISITKYHKILLASIAIELICFILAALTQSVPFCVITNI